MTSPFPTTNYICWLLKQRRTKAEAGQEARRLGVRLDYAEWCWRTTNERF